MPTFHFNLKEQDCPLCKAELSSLRQENERLRDALEWYEAQARNCFKVSREGHDAQIALAEDSGNRARQALTKEG